MLPEHRWADMDSLSVGHHAGKLQLEVTNVSEPSWGSPSGLRHDLVGGGHEKHDFGRWTVVFGVLLWVMVRSH